MAKRTITIPSCREHQGRYSITLSVEWVCPVCGGPRGEPYKTVSYDGSLQLRGVDGWQNPCGHLDTYIDIRQEAGLNYGAWLEYNGLEQDYQPCVACDATGGVSIECPDCGGDGCGRCACVGSVTVECPDCEGEGEIDTRYEEYMSNLKAGQS